MPQLWTPAKNKTSYACGMNLEYQNEIWWGSLKKTVQPPLVSAPSGRYSLRQEIDDESFKGMLVDPNQIDGIAVILNPDLSTLTLLTLVPRDSQG
jgi:hypothetical protein